MNNAGGAFPWSRSRAGPGGALSCCARGLSPHTGTRPCSSSAPGPEQVHQRGNAAPNIPACGISPATSQWVKRKELVTYKAEGPTDVLLLI